MALLPLTEMVIAGPKVAIVNREVSLAPFLAKSELLPHVPVVVQAEALQF